VLRGEKKLTTYRKESDMLSSAPRGSFLNALKDTSLRSGKKANLVSKLSSYLGGNIGDRAMEALQRHSCFKMKNGTIAVSDADLVYGAISYLKRRPTDILLDKSVRSFLESVPLKDEIKIPPLEKGCLWLDLSQFGLECVGYQHEKVSDYDVDSKHRIKGLFLSQYDEEMLKWMEFWVDDPMAYLSKMKQATVRQYVGLLVLEDYFPIFFPLHEDQSFGRLFDLISSSGGFLGGVADQLEVLSALRLGLVALQMVSEGHFVKDTRSYEEKLLPLGQSKVPSRKNKGKKPLKKKYREFRVTHFRHIDSPEKETGSGSGGSREITHYTPRNVRSHFKERWVTLEYVERHNVPNEDIIDMETKTKLYKTGEKSKDWVKIKLWYEYEQDWFKEPVQEIEKYRV